MNHVEDKMLKFLMEIHKLNKLIEDQKNLDHIVKDFNSTGWEKFYRFSLNKQYENNITINEEFFNRILIHYENKSAEKKKEIEKQIEKIKSHAPSDEIKNLAYILDILKT